MKIAHRYRPLALRPDEEALIEAIITWAAAERRIHGHLPDLPARIATVGGDVVVRCDARAVEEEDEDDYSVLRFRNMELT